MLTENVFQTNIDPEMIVQEATAQAKNNNVAAQYRLALFYENGCFVRKSLKKALKWYLAAAENDHGGAQYVIGHYFEQGKGTAKNLEDAINWYRLAAKNQHPYAKEKLISLMLGEIN